MAAAGGASAPFEDQDYLDYAFKIRPYVGTGSTQTIDCGYGMNLQEMGGLVWIKRRDGTGDHYMCDTVSGVNKYHSPHNQTFQTSGGPVSAFTKTGFTLGGSVGNVSGAEYVAWVFRNKNHFFKVLKYTGTGSSQDVPHTLGSQIGMVWVHNMSAAKDMVCDHYRLTNGHWINVNGSAASVNDSGNRFGNRFDNYAFNPTDDPDTNESGDEYIAYCWGTGGANFGASGSQSDVIQCDHYTGNGSVDGPHKSTNWQPQFLLFKNAGGAGNWEIADTTRGVSSYGTDKMNLLRPNTTGGEFEDNSTAFINKGFKVHNPGGSNNDNGSQYIYMVIRKPDGKTTSTQHLSGLFEAPNTDCLHIGQSSASATAPTFATAMERPDFSIIKNFYGGVDNWWVGSRAMHYDKYIQLNNTLPSDHSLTIWDVWKGCHKSWNATNCGYIFKDCRSFDSVIYRGTGSSGNYVRHGLGVTPTMIWCKGLETADNIGAWHSHGMSGSDKKGYYKLDTNNALLATTTQYWGQTAEIDHRWFRIDTHDTQVNENGKYHLAMVFADVAGYTKSGIYTGTTTSEQTCGFSPRLIMVKGTHDTNWMWFDTVRGITAGNDSSKALNSTADEDTSSDWVDVSSTGWTPQGGGNHINASTKNYMWFAWA